MDPSIGFSPVTIRDEGLARKLFANSGGPASRAGHIPMEVISADGKTITRVKWAIDPKAWDNGAGPNRPISKPGKENA
jgi:hypothetical protein